MRSVVPCSEYLVNKADKYHTQVEGAIEKKDKFNK